jgi:hypothetical protein
LFGQALAKDLGQFKVPKSTVIQYVDDILLCSPSRQYCEEETVKLLNFLAKRDTRSLEAKPSSVWKVLNA